MQETCVGNPLEDGFEGCKCVDAQKHIDNGAIVCGEELCPEDCEVCKTCLYHVIDDCMDTKTHSPTKTPTFQPTHAPTKTATEAPTAVKSMIPTLSPTTEHTQVPTLLESMMPTLSPTTDHTATPTIAPTADEFDISVCSTYSLNW